MPEPERLTEIQRFLEVTPTVSVDYGDKQALVFDDPYAAQHWAIANSPVFQQVLANLRVEDARVWQASLLSNPGLEFGVFEPEAVGRWRLEGGLHVGLFSLLGRDRRVNIAEAEHLLWQLEALTDISKFLADIRNAWLAVVASQQRLQIHQTILESSILGAELAALMRGAGTLNEFDHLLQQSSAAVQQGQLRGAEMHLQDALTRLRTLLGVPPGMAIVVPSRLPEYRMRNEISSLLSDTEAMEPFAASEELLGLALTHNPSLRKLAAQLDQQFRLEDGIKQRTALMNMGVGLHIEREFDGQLHNGLALSLSPPLFDRGQADLALVSAQTQSMVATHRLQLLNTHNQIALALQRRALSRLDLEQLEMADLPRYQRLQELALLEYNFMLRGGFDLLQLRQHTLQAQLRQVDALLTWSQASADLAHSLGLELTIEGVQHD
jgi:cobalt-zinc-cadmium efflux system outer membrane protein